MISSHINGVDQQSTYRDYRFAHIPSGLSRDARPKEHIAPSLTTRHSSPHSSPDLQKPTDNNGFPLRRFWFRSIVGILGPWVVCAYFIVIWRMYLAPIDQNDPIAFGLPGANYVYYSWFIAGVIGLNLSLYGLAGVEPGMLMEPSWGTDTAMKLMLHADNTWSGPGGWMKTIKWMIQSGDSPGILWCALALPSILVFVAWPLSGLTMEITQGLIHGHNGGSLVTGFSYNTFNERTLSEAFTGARFAWLNALDASVPGIGLVYTQEDTLNRHEIPFLNQLPTRFPKDQGVPRIFLTSQAANPIEGITWGMLLQYDCKVIESVEEFTILRDRKPSIPVGVDYDVQDGASGIATRNQTHMSRVNLLAPNIYGVTQFGARHWPNKTVITRMLEDDPLALSTKQTNCYFNEAENITGDYPGIDQETIFEIAVWQHLTTPYINSANGTRPNYNLTIDHNITDLYGAYNMRDFSETPANDTSDQQLDPMSAIGVQCKASSSVGTARINGERSSYSNFTRTDTPIDAQADGCTPRLEARIPIWMFDDDLLAGFFSSSRAPPPFRASETMLQLNYLQAEDLRRSMLHAYASYAVQLMYTPFEGFTLRNGHQVNYNNPNVTEFIPTSVLQLGIIPPVVPIVLFSLWALISSSLGLIYGFRRRWTEIVDGYTMFRLGTSLPEAREVEVCSNTLDVENCEALHRIPGMVGDREADNLIGRIGLVRQRRTDKSKSFF